MQIINRFEQIVYKYDLCLFKFVSLTRVAVTHTAIVYVKFNVFFFCLLFVYIVTSIYERTLDVASFSSLKLRIGGCSSCLFVCLNSACLLFLFCLPQLVTRRVCCVSIAAVVVCLHSVYLYNYYLHKVLLIRFTGVYEWVSGMMRPCVYVFVLTDSTKKLNK